VHCPLFDQGVFVVGNQPYTWSDVVLAAKCWGDWAELEREVRHGIACVKHFADTGEPSHLEEVQAAARAFRYTHNLLTAQQMETWLRQWELTPKAWTDYLQRSVLRHKWSAILEDLMLHYQASNAEVERCLMAEGLCSGHFTRFAYKLAAHAAVYPSSQHAHHLSLAASPATMPTLLNLDAAFQDFCVQIVTPRALHDQTVMHRLDWIRFDCHAMSFPTEEMACEAALCVREDGTELAEVALQARTTVQQHRFYLDQIPSAWRAHFLGAQQGDAIGPLPGGRAFSLFVLREKRLPMLDDPDIRQRAAQEVVQQAIDRKITEQVHWLSGGFPGAWEIG